MIYDASLRPSCVADELRSDWRIEYSAAADARLAYEVRAVGFDFCVAAEALSQWAGASGAWAAPRRLITADEVRRRWAVLDGLLCAQFRT